MDQNSIASHFHIEPAVKDIKISWPNPKTALISHSLFRTSTEYQAILEGGYRDRQGGSNPLRHSWKFKTELPPELIAATPNDKAKGFDPAGELQINFSQEMDLNSLQTAIKLEEVPSTPSPTPRKEEGEVSFRLITQSAGRGQVVIVPTELLRASTTYTLAIDKSGRDIDGNQLKKTTSLKFTTGDTHSLKGWIGFLGSDSAGNSGIWGIDPNQFDRRLLTASATSFSWSPDGSQILAHTTDQGWISYSITTGQTTVLPWTASMAAFLKWPDGNLGYVALDGDSLKAISPTGDQIPIASGVSSPAVDPSGNRLAFVMNSGNKSEIDTYDISLRSRSQLQTEAGTIDQLTWSPDQNSLAYRLTPNDPQRRQLRVKSLTGQGDTFTLINGPISSPQWQSDSQHLFVELTMSDSQIYRVSTGQTSLITSGKLPVNESQVKIESFALSPDGRQIALIGSISGLRNIFLMNSDGSGLRQLVNPGLIPPTLSPSANLLWGP